MTAGPSDPFTTPGGSSAGVPSYGSQQYGAPTPGLPPGMPSLATWGQRVGGYLIDVLITVLVAVPAFLISEALYNVVAIGAFLVFGYLTGTTGQTPGRKVMGITVLRERDGQVLGAGAGIGRSFLHILDALPLYVGFLWPIWDAKKQTFADKIIKSVVVSKT